MIMKTILDLSNGRKVMGLPPDTLQAANRSKEISLVFDTGEIYSGFFNGIGDDNDIHLTKPGVIVGVILPLTRLVAWFYKED